MPALTEEQRLLVDTVGDLAENEFADRAFEWEGAIPWENLQTLTEHGLYGFNFDETYGGGGLSEFEVILVSEAIGRICPNTARVLTSMHMIGPRAIDMFGTEAAKERYLPGVIDAEELIAIAISEPNAGSDVGSMNTTVEETSGGLVVNGEKTWVTYFEESRAAVLWAKFPEGLGTIILDLDAPGIEVSNHFTNMAGESQTHFFINDVTVPETNVLARGRDAFREQLAALNWERLGVAAMSNAIAGSALDLALEYATDREQFGQPIADFQGIEWKLADMVKKLEASRALMYRAAETAVASDRVPDPLETHIANLYAGEVTEEIVSEALQIHGANGYQRGHPLEYLYRFQRGFQIGGGTNEIQKNTIASRLKNEGVPSIR